MGDVVRVPQCPVQSFIELETGNFSNSSGVKRGCLPSVINLSFCRSAE
jgi:hypothetical protein